MDMRIQGRNIEITRSIREHVAAKLASLDRHLPSVARADVEMASEPTRSEKDRVVVQVSLNVSGDLLRAQRRAGNARVAVNTAVEALDRQLDRWKSQTYRSSRQSRFAPDADAALASDNAAAVIDAVGAGNGVGQEGDGRDLVRIKRFRMEPMSFEEAAQQMEYLDHSFYMFLDAETRMYSVLYLREDSNYGLIQPAEV